MAGQYKVEVLRDLGVAGEQIEIVVKAFYIAGKPENHMAWAAHYGLDPGHTLRVTEVDTGKVVDGNRHQLDRAIKKLDKMWGPKAKEVARLLRRIKGE